MFIRKCGGGGFTVKIAQRRSERGGIVANDRLLPERHGRIPDRDAERGERFLVRRDGNGPFAEIFLLRFGRDGKIVYKGIVEQSLAAVVEERADVIDGGIPRGLAALRHKIHNIDPLRRPTRGSPRGCRRREGSE